MVVEADLTGADIAAGDIVYGKALGDVVQAVEVPESQRRYPIEAQLNDLLDDILASVPPHQRTRTRMQNIHTMLERYKELRQQYSEFDEAGNPSGPLRKTATHRPLLGALRSLRELPEWVVPISRNIKKVYNIDGEAPYGDVAMLSLSEQLAAETTAAEAVNYGERRGPA